MQPGKVSAESDDGANACTPNPVRLHSAEASLLAYQMQQIQESMQTKMTELEAQPAPNTQKPTL